MTDRAILAAFLRGDAIQAIARRIDGRTASPAIVAQIEAVIRQALLAVRAGG